MKKLYRRSISGLLALLICFTAILGSGMTAYAAAFTGETADSYSVAWTNVRWHSSVPARWGNSRRIGAWNDWSSDLRQKRSSFLFHPCRRSVSDDVSRTE